MLNYLAYLRCFYSTWYFIISVISTNIIICCFIHIDVFLTVSKSSIRTEPDRSKNISDLFKHFTKKYNNFKLLNFSLFKFLNN